MARDLRLLARGVALGKTHLTEQGVSMIQGLHARGLMLGLAAVALCISGGAFAQGGKITVGLDGTFAAHPMPKLGGGIEGFNVDMANEIGKRLNRPIEVVATEF